MDKFIHSVREKFTSIKKKGNNDQSEEPTKSQSALISKEAILKHLNGKTLMIYFVLLNKKETGVRELQRSLELSSPSVARYHLDKLTEIGLVENRNGIYHLIRKAEIPALTSWVLFGKFILPRVLFAACFFSLIFLGYIIFFFSFLHKDSFFVILLSGLIISYLWFDVWWHLKNRPF